MAEVKNAFIKSKMNKDLDDRLIPSGEYRDGLNIQVSKSEGEDVGALENAIGNKLAESDISGVNVDFNIISGCNCSLNTIGMYADENTSSIYVFLTNGSETDYNYNPDVKNYIYSYNTLTKAVTKLVEGAFLNFSTLNPVYGINLLENLLFWTDNRNQPRKININIGFENYTNEDRISVAKYNPYRTMELYYTNPTPIGTINAGTPLTSMQDVVTPLLPDGSVNPFYNAPLSQAIPAGENWPGDPDYLEDKFVSFSYRFKFEDGEYSIMAPFTQEAFIPKQDGYFLTGDEDDAYRSTIVRFMENKVNNVGLKILFPQDKSGADFTGNQLSGVLGISSIEILYKESDGLTIKVLDSISSFGTTSSFLYSYQSKKPYKTLPESETIRVYDKVPVKALGQEIVANRVVYSNFQDKHTPPATINYDVIVSEKETFSAPDGGNKSLYTTSITKYPMHTVKQNRNCQVGFVLSDRFGRQSTTILSPANLSTKSQTIGGTTYSYGGSTYYHPYAANPANLTPVQANNIDSWPGDSIKIVVNQSIVPTNGARPRSSDGWPGLYNGDPTNLNYNPLGWYSYKVVVKQTEQDYYNVYTPGIMGFYPDKPTPLPDEVGTVAFIVLLNDNINKVPRDLTEVGPDQKQYRSGVQLYARVSPSYVAQPSAIFGNNQYYPTVNNSPKDNTVSTISLQNDMFNNNPTPSAALPIEYGAIYQTASNPSIARITQIPNAVSSNIGYLGSNVTAGSGAEVAQNILLGVFETTPVTSLLDLFYETSTTGLISELNETSGESTDVSGFIFNWVQSEATASGAFAVEGFYPTFVDGIDPNAPIINSTVELVSVVDGNGNDVRSYWGNLLETAAAGGQPKKYSLKVAQPQYFDPTLDLNDYTFTFNITDLGLPLATPPVAASPIQEGLTITKTLINVKPTITGTVAVPNVVPTTVSVPSDRDAADSVVQFLAVNGTIVTADNAKALVWSISRSASALPIITIDSEGRLFADITASGSYSFLLKVIDTAGTGLEDEIPISIVFGQEQLNADFGYCLNKDISVGLESFGLYWSSNRANNNVITSTPIPSVVSNSYGTGGGRPAYGGSAGTGGVQESLVLANQLNTQTPAISREQKFTNTNFLDRNFSPQSSGTPYQFKNTNYNTSYLRNTVSSTDNSLKTGTAFIKLDFKFKSWPRVQNLSAYTGVSSIYPTKANPGASWPIYLQYRATETDNWTTAIDIEGEEIRFGGTQRNISQPNDAATNPLRNFGVLQTYAGVSALGKNGAINGEPTASVDPSPLDIATACAQYPVLSNNAAQLPTTSVLSKVFAFGVDQMYSEETAKTGEYRLLCRYPQASNTQSSYITLPNPQNNQAGNGIQSSIYSIGGSQLSSVNMGVKITMGDFYYPPFGTNGAISDTLSYQYSCTPSGTSSAANASLGSMSKTVWAREWDLKYVTQFYTSSDLRTPVTFDVTSGGWICYSPRDNDNSETYGTHNSWWGTQGDAIAVVGSTYSAESLYPSSNAQDVLTNRKFAANFSATGLKVKKSAVPITVDIQI